MLKDFYSSLSFGYCYNTGNFKFPAGGRAQFISHCCVRGSWVRPGEKAPSISYLCPVKLFLPLEKDAFHDMTWNASICITLLVISVCVFSWHFC